MLNNLDRFAPPGMELKGCKDFSSIALVGNVLFSAVSFLTGTFNLWQALPPRETWPHPTTVVTWPFTEALGISMEGFWIFAISMVAFVVMNYLYFFDGSKSVYTMRRIKNPWELHLRCWTLPLCSAAVLLLCRVVLTVVYFLIFMLVTPKGLPIPGWSQLLRGLFL